MGFKDINFSIAMYGTDVISQPSYPVVYTGDESSVKLNFTITDEGSLAGATAKVHLHFADSTHIEKPMEINLLVLSYTLTGTQNDHAGIVRADVFITLDGKTYTKAGYKFRIDSSLEANPNIVEYSVETVDKVVTETESWLLQAQTDFGVAQNQRAAEWVVDNDTRDDQFDAAQADRTTSFNASEAGRTAAFNTNETGRSNTFTVNENARQAAAVANESTRDGNYSAAEVIRDNQYEVAEANRDAISGIDHLQAVSDHQTAGTDHTTAIGDHNTSVADHSTFDASQTQRTEDFSAAQTGRADTFAASEAGRTTTFNASEAGRTTAFNSAETARAAGYTADHNRAGTDHTTAVNDHVLAGTDHTTASNDHTLAGTDHTRAETDHTRADVDSATVAGFNSRLTAEETATAANKVSAVKSNTFADVDARFEDVEFDTTAMGTNINTNGDFSNGYSEWVITGSVGAMDTSTKVIGAQSLKLTPNGGGWCKAYRQIAVVVGRKYYFSAHIKNDAFTEDVAELVYINQSGLTNYANKRVANLNVYRDWTRFSTIMETNLLNIIITYGLSFYSTIITKSVWLDGVSVIDLTATFGAGNEPTVEQMDEIMNKFENSWFDGTKNLFRAKEALTKQLVLDERTEFDAVNLVENGEFINGTTGWDLPAGYGTLSASDNILTITATDDTWSVAHQLGKSFPTNNKIYISAMVKNVAGGVTLAICDNINGYSVVNQVTNVLANTWYRLRGIYNASDWPMGQGIRIHKTGLTAIGDVTQIQYPLIIDLTATFGVDKEPTLAEMDRLMARFPNSWFDGVKPIQTIETLYQEKANKVQEAWITPTLINGATGTIQYRKNEFGTVEFRGTLTGSAGSGLLVMPNGYRTTVDVRLVCASSQASSVYMLLQNENATSAIFIEYPYGTQTVDMTGFKYST